MGWNQARRRASYQEFGNRFGAYGYYHGYRKAIGTTKDLDLPATQKDVDDPALTKEVKKALQRNGAASNDQPYHGYA